MENSTRAHENEVTISPQDFDKNKEDDTEISSSHINIPNSVVESEKRRQDVLSAGNTEEGTNNMIEEEETINNQSEKAGASITTMPVGEERQEISENRKEEVNRVESVLEFKI